MLKYEETQTQCSDRTLSGRNYARFAKLAAAAALALAVPSTAKSFYQATNVEGTIGQDLNGVWLATYNVMPSFRVRVDTDPDTKAPWTVGPIPQELAPLVGDDLKGVQIKSIGDPEVAGKYAIFEGDLITKINTVNIDDVEQYHEALGEVKEWFLVSIRRPKLKFTNARLVKIRYSADEIEVDGVSELGAEKIEMKVLTNILPFADDVETARRNRDTYSVSDEQVEALKKNWFELEIPEMSPYVQGEHRIVAESDYDQSLRRDENLRDTDFAIVTTLKGNALAGQVGQNIGVYGVRSVTADRVAGTYVESTLASAPFPINIDFNGAFVLTKLDDWSNRDVEHLLELKRKADAGKEPERDPKDIKVAPDVP